MEIGSDSIAFKKVTRLLDPLELLDAYNEQRILKIIDTKEMNVIVGMILWEINDNKIHFGPFAVLPSRKGQGIGKLLINKLYDIAKEHDIHIVEIKVVNVRTDLIPFYEKLGYILTGEGAYPHPDRLTRPVYFYLYTKHI